ncbi:MAG: hypothetical protein IJO97_05425 [Lachnospiraceae bacterium]|nr:hypothetical protein [Lachnospiraceae bacterium]
MPEKILALLEKGSLTEWQIAETLGISIEEVKACISYLQNMHFIKSSVMNATGSACSNHCSEKNGGSGSSHCSGGCSGCGGSSSSSSGSTYTIWEII